jgi:hypothetical protein
VSVQKRQSVVGLRILAPKLEKFSDRQIEVAQTWALQFNVPPSQLTSFIDTYLSSTVHLDFCRGQRFPVFANRKKTADAPISTVVVTINAMAQRSMFRIKIGGALQFDNLQPIWTHEGCAG